MAIEACTVVGKSVKVGYRGAAADSVVGCGPGGWDERSAVVLVILFEGLGIGALVG